MRAPLACAVLLVHSANGLLATPAICRTSTLSFSRSSFVPRGSSARVSQCTAAAASRALATPRMDATESISSYLNIPEERILKVSVVLYSFLFTRSSCCARVLDSILQDCSRSAVHSCAAES
jgi:hypothetical protein